MTGFSTPLSSRLGLTYPLVAAPMFLISNRDMLRACAEAGILGAMPSLNARSSDAFEEDLQWLSSSCPGPYAINLTIGLTPKERLSADLELCFKYKVPVLITSYGDPSSIVKAAHEKDVIVFHDVINLRHAQRAASAGVDAIISVSQGAGGHAGQINPLVLIPYLKSQLDIPIIGAGCISGGAQVAAVLSLGAELAYIGTRFIASTECGASSSYKDLVVSSTHADIIYTDKVSGTHANFLKQTLPDVAIPSADAKRWRDIWSAGQGVSLVHDVKSIAEIVADITDEYTRHVCNLPQPSPR